MDFLLLKPYFLFEDQLIVIDPSSGIHYTQQENNIATEMQVNPDKIKLGTFLELTSTVAENPSIFVYTAVVKLTTGESITIKNCKLSFASSNIEFPFRKQITSKDITRTLKSLQGALQIFSTHETRTQETLFKDYFNTPVVTIGEGFSIIQNVEKLLHLASAAAFYSIGEGKLLEKVWEDTNDSTLNILARNLTVDDIDKFYLDSEEYEPLKTLLPQEIQLDDSLSKFFLLSVLLLFTKNDLSILTNNNEFPRFPSASNNEVYQSFGETPLISENVEVIPAYGSEKMSVENTTDPIINVSPEQSSMTGGAATVQTMDNPSYFERMRDSIPAQFESLIYTTNKLPGIGISIFKSDQLKQTFYEHYGYYLALFATACFIHGYSAKMFSADKETMSKHYASLSKNLQRTLSFTKEDLMSEEARLEFPINFLLQQWKVFLDTKKQSPIATNIAFFNMLQKPERQDSNIDSYSSTPQTDEPHTFKQMILDMVGDIQQKPLAVSYYMKPPKRDTNIVRIIPYHEERVSRKQNKSMEDTPELLSKQIISTMTQFANPGVSGISGSQFLDMIRIFEKKMNDSNERTTKKLEALQKELKELKEAISQKKNKEKMSSKQTKKETSTDEEDNDEDDDEMENQSLTKEELLTKYEKKKEELLQKQKSINSKLSTLDTENSETSPESKKKLQKQLNIVTQELAVLEKDKRRRLEIIRLNNKISKITDKNKKKELLKLLKQVEKKLQGVLKGGKLSILNKKIDYYRYLLFD